MDVRFTSTPAPAPEPIIFEQVFAEKPGGGLLANSSFDVKKGMALGLNADGKYQAMKAPVLYEDAAAEATTIKVKKGSAVVTGDYLGTGKVAARVSKVVSTDSNFDTLTITLGVEVKAGKVLFQASEEADGTDTEAAPLLPPVYLCGENVPAGVGDKMVRLVNGANIRKETAPVADEVVALMKSIAKV